MTQPTLFDPCENKHGGNAESEAAFERATKTAQVRREQILRLLDDRGTYGATAKEAAQCLGVELHALSGRFTELKASYQIVVTNQRRDGSRVCVHRRWAE